MSVGRRMVRLSQHLDLEDQLEVLQLKTKLQEMTEMVQQLLQHLSILEKMPGFSSKGTPQKNSVAMQTSIPDEKQWEQSASVREKMKELVDMNLNWQKYNMLQEKHIHELNDKVEGLTRQMKSQSSNQRYQPDEHLDQLQKENLELEVRVEELMLRLINSPSPLERGGGGRGGAIAGPESSIQATSERDQLMTAQLMMFKEDFEMERKDREKAQAKIVELEDELHKLQKQMRQVTPGFHSEERVPSKPPSAFSVDKQSDSHRRKPNAPNTSYTRDDLATDAVDVTTSDQVYLPPHPAVKNILDNPDGRSRIDAKEDVLRCPRCFQIFRKLDHSELLDHIEQCRDRKPAVR